MPENMVRDAETGWVYWLTHPGEEEQFTDELGVRFTLAGVNEQHAVQWIGQPDAMQGFATNAWLERDGEPVDLEDLQPWTPAADPSCDQCEGMPIHGVIAPINEPTGIERCDQCEVFESDLDAASALAEHLGPGLTVWFWQ